MSFLVRATLVIGFLSWLALQRQGATTAESATDLGAEAALAAWDALPAPARAAALRAGGTAIAHHADSTPASGDTLVDADRAPAWRGGGMKARD